MLLSQISQCENSVTDSKTKKVLAESPFKTSRHDARFKQNTNGFLMDKTYGSTLIHRSTVAFKGLPPALPQGSVSLSNKVSSALSVLRSNDVLLIGSNFEVGKTLLKDSLKSFQNVFKRLLFIEDSKLENVITISKNIRGFDEITNINPESLKLVDAKGQVLGVEKGESCFLSQDDRVLAKGSLINISYTHDMGQEAIRNSFLKVIEMPDFGQNEIEKINSKLINAVSLKPQIREDKLITFDNIGGQKEAIDEIKNKIIRPLKFPIFFKNMKIPKSYLFVGPPGNAKTLTANALANTLEIPFFNVNGQLLEGSLVGESAKNIHEYYETIRKQQPCIVFYDEIDAILPKRRGVNTYADQSVNMHLDEISRLEKENANVILIGATNHPEIIDDAALRSGRFGCRIEFKNPSLEGCKEIFDVHSSNIKLEDVDTKEFCDKMHKENVSGADIATILSTAKFNSIKRQGIFEAMDLGTFEDKEDFKLILKPEDLEDSLKEYIKNKGLLTEYENKSKSTRVEEIKNEYQARETAKVEINKTIPKRPKIGYTEYEKTA